VHGFPAPHIGIGYDGGTVNMTASINDQNAGSVDPVKDTVTFTGTISVNVSFDHSSIWSQIFSDGSASDRVGGDVQSATQNLLQGLLNFSLPQVNAFAVSNLLFPQEHILSFRTVYVPGDLLILGDVQTSSVATSPLFVTLTSGQTQQFTATLPSTDTKGVTWSMSPPVGTISTSGLYTAPATVTSAASVVMTATSNADSSNTSSAIVTLVANGVQISPVFALMTPNTQPQQFSAAVAGSGSQAVTWAMSPQVGTLSPGGLYTPPSSVAQPTAVTITATSTANAKVTGNATVILMATGPNGVAVSPPSLASPLTPLQSQQFSATVQGTTDQEVTWSLVPLVGTISSTGLYRAPTAIATPQPVLVVATSALTSVLYGTAVVMLAPSSG
jgi:hypothetical protein